MVLFECRRGSFLVKAFANGLTHMYGSSVCVSLLCPLLCSQWVAKLSHNNVIISTAQVLLNLLDKGREYLTMERLNLLIIDECHRASKQHPVRRTTPSVMYGSVAWPW